MIQKTQFGAHENVLIAEFGTGDIKIVRSRFEDEKHERVLAFYNQPVHEIGEETEEWRGKHSDELESPSLLMSFSRPESITALIELQKSVFEHIKTD